MSDTSEFDSDCSNASSESEYETETDLEEEDVISGDEEDDGNNSYAKLKYVAKNGK